MADQRTTGLSKEQNLKKSAALSGNIDWERIRKVLVVRAVQLCRLAERVADTTTADDLACEVIMEFFNHPKRMGWDPKLGPLEWFLVTVLNRKWIEQCRREAKGGDSFDDDDTFSGQAGQLQDPLKDLERQEMLERIRQQVRDDPELVEFVDAVELLDGDYLEVDKNVAELIGTSVEDVENRKRRLRTRVGLGL
jgi:DNA-directed RNA polymerase specialized sigma24 family protein